MEHIHGIERRIIGKLVTDILAAGYCISVNNGVEWALKQSTGKQKILREVGATQETHFVIRRPSDHTRIGWIWLIHGNLNDVISDYTANPTIQELVAGASELADTLA